MTRVHRLQGPGLQRVTIIAGITGMSSDADILRGELARLEVRRILLGVPFEDLDSIRATSGKERETEFEAGTLDDVYLERLKKFGAVESPPPDLYVAYRHAETGNIPIQAIDLGDEAYTEAYTKHVGFFEVLRSNRRQKGAPSAEIEAPDADTFVHGWHEMLNASKGLRRVQAERSQHMVQAIVAAAKEPGVVALVPLVLVPSILERLEKAGWSKA